MTSPSGEAGGAQDPTWGSLRASDIRSAAEAESSGRSRDRSSTGGLSRWKLIAAVEAAALFVAVVAIVAMLSTGGDSPVPALAASVNITVKEVVNQVEVDQSGDAATAANFQPVTLGQELAPGDGLKTFEASEARVDISVGEFVRVSRTKPNTVWRLGQFTVEDETVIELDQGTIFLFDDSSGPSPKPLKVITPAGTASPKGTWMSMSYDPVTKVAELQCFRGACLLENDLGSELLVDEQKTTITQQAPPRKPIVMSKTETRLFVDLPEAVSGEVVIPAPQPAFLPTLEPTDTPPAPAAVVPSTEARPAVVPPTEAPPALVPNLGPKPTPTPEPIVVVPTAEVTASASSGVDEPPGPAPASSPVNADVSASPTADEPPTAATASSSSGEETPTSTDAPATAASLPSSLGVPFPVADQSVLPHVFVGTAKLNGVPAPDGTVVSAWVEGLSEPLAESVIASNEFSILVNQYGSGSLEGETVVFKVDGWIADIEGIWTSGGADVLDLDAGTG